jgi:hypothetical protein
MRIITKNHFTYSQYLLLAMSTLLIGIIKNGSDSVVGST